MGLTRVFDDRGRAIEFASPPQRIVSLVPSDTLSVADLGAGARLVGRTDYCVLPEGIESVPSVGGTKNPRIDEVTALAPDLVLANQEENTKADLEALATRGVRIYVAFPKRVAEGLTHLAKLAMILGVARDPGVVALVRRGYEAHREALAARAAARAPVRVFCPIWMSPLMTIHGDTFISDMLDLCGAQNVFADRERQYPLAADLGRAAASSADRVAGRDVRYPRVAIEEVEARAPELIVLPDEPHPFSDADVKVFRATKTPAAARGAVVRCDGKDICWYGSRSADAIGRLRALVAGSRTGSPLA